MRCGRLSAKGTCIAFAGVLYVFRGTTCPTIATEGGAEATLLFSFGYQSDCVCLCRRASCDSFESRAKFLSVVRESTVVKKTGYCAGLLLSQLHVKGLTELSRTMSYRHGFCTLQQRGPENPCHESAVSYLERARVLAVYDLPVLVGIPTSHGGNFVAIIRRRSLGGNITGIGGIRGRMSSQGSAEYLRIASTAHARAVLCLQAVGQAMPRHIDSFG